LDPPLGLRPPALAQARPLAAAVRHTRRHHVPPRRLRLDRLRAGPDRVDVSAGVVTQPRAQPWFDATRVVVFRPGDYARVHALQRERLEARIAGSGGDVLLAGEHEPVVTLGRGMKQELAPLPVRVVAIERGGQATWHGPGQLVVYPILSLVE